MHEIRNTIIYLIGFHGIGKRTIAKELVKLSDAIMIDNHLINNPIFQIYSKQLHLINDDAWDKVEDIRDIVLEAIIDFPDKKQSFVFTNDLRNDSIEDIAIFNKIKNLAEVRGSQFIPVILSCDKEELKKRIINVERAKYHKITDPKSVEDLDISTQFKIQEALKLDVSKLTSKAVAEIILEHIT